MSLATEFEERLAYTVKLRESGYYCFYDNTDKAHLCSTCDYKDKEKDEYCMNAKKLRILEKAIKAKYIKVEYPCPDCKDDSCKTCGGTKKILVDVIKDAE